jgi:hypothetical protein
MSAFFKYSYCFDRPGAPVKNHTNTVPAVSMKKPSEAPVTLGARQFVPTYEFSPGHNGIKKP